ncbi:MAG: MBOAT family protein [Alphaproteobacteria bacterium]|nr:MBOAT family protein [Alphaproteobacteria bacterium]
MLFVEPRFLIFFALIFAIYWAMPWHKGRKLFLLGGSYLFYAAWDWRFLGLILLSTIVDFVIGQRIENNRAKKKSYVIISLIVNLGFLGIFKYFNFFVESAIDLASTFDLTLNHTTLNIILPVGISFYTFQTLSYTLDIYRKKLKPQKDIFDFALFVAFFPQLVAGPIVRAKDFLPQLKTKHLWSSIPVKACLLLFLVGFIKKTVISDNLAFTIDQVFSDPDSYTHLSIITANLLYTIQIYCDFSGYTDMAIAIAGLLGFKLAKNFDAPYLATSIIGFWKRWHISLSTWLRDYLYISLGGNRKGELIRYRNLMLTMVLGGLWHGAAWTFVIWGLIHGLALSINHLWHKLKAPKIPALLSWAITFYIVSACWIFFRANDITTALSMAKSYTLIGDAGTQILGDLYIFILVGLLGLHFIWRKAQLEQKLVSLSAPIFSGLLGMAVPLILLFHPAGYQPFIYFQF